MTGSVDDIVVLYNEDKTERKKTSDIRDEQGNTTRTYLDTEEPIRCFGDICDAYDDLPYCTLPVNNNIDTLVNLQMNARYLHLYRLIEFWVSDGVRNGQWGER